MDLFWDTICEYFYKYTYSFVRLSKRVSVFLHSFQPSFQQYFVQNPTYMKTLNKTTVKIALSCFLAPTIFGIVFLLYIVTLYQSIGFRNYIVLPDTVLGCILQPWNTYFQIFHKFYHLFWILLAYVVSRKGFIKQNINLKILGAFLFYPALFLTFRKLHNPFNFLANKGTMIIKNAPIFGNRYNLYWFMYITETLLLLLTVFIIYRIAFKFWDKKLRVHYLTIGFISTLIGGIFWFIFIGKYITHYLF